jgi:hypothetical protein
MVAVVTNGTAVLGLGSIGALASKPVMEGKAVLFKKFAGIDSIDIEVEERDPRSLIEVVAALEPSFGAINLEDIKAPECFEVERTLRERMRIPVFHDDQHGTAIIVAAAVLNGLILQGKNLSDVKLVNTGGGAAALACLDLLVERGLRRENVTVCDIEGVVYQGRTSGMDPYKARYARATEARRLEEVLDGADVFLGLSAPRVLKPEWLSKLAPEAPGAGPGQPGPRNPARSGARRPAGRHRRHRPERLPEPGQQRPLLPLHLPRRAGRGRDGHQRGDEDRRRRGHRPPWPAWRRARWWPRPTAATPRCSAPSTSSPSPSTRG